MPRKRRSPEEAKTEILHAAKQLLLEEGTDSLKLSRIAKKAKFSHPLVLHHFGSIQSLLFSLQESIARELRNDLLSSFQNVAKSSVFKKAATLVKAMKTWNAKPQDAETPSIATLPRGELL